MTLQLRREKAKLSASKNEYKHSLSRGGYVRQEEVLISQGLERLQSEVLAAGEDPNTITREMVPLPNRAEMWKLSHMYHGTGEYITQESQEIGKNIVSTLMVSFILSIYSSNVIT